MQSFSKFIAGLILILKENIVIWNIDNSDKYINKRQVNVCKKKLGKRNQNFNKINFLFSNTKIILITLQHVFITAFIICFFGLKYYIRSKIDSSGYIIDQIFNHLTLYNLS